MHHFSASFFIPFKHITYPPNNLLRGVGGFPALSRTQVTCPRSQSQKEAESDPAPDALTGAESQAHSPWVSPRPSWPKMFFQGTSSAQTWAGPLEDRAASPHPGWSQLPQMFPHSSPTPHITQTWVSSLCLAWGHTRTLTSPCWGFQGSRKDPGQLEHAVLRSFLATPRSLQALLLCSSLPLTWGAHHSPSYHPLLPPS